MSKFAKKAGKVVIAALSAVLFTVIGAGAYSMEENFESYDIGSGKCGFESCSGTVSGDESNKYLLLDPGTAAVKYTDTCKGSVNVSVRFMQTNKITGRLLMLWDTAHSARSNLMWLTNNSIVLAMNNGSAEADRTLCSVSDNTWYTVKLTLDFDLQRITQIYVDEIPMLDEPVAMYSTSSNVDDLGSIEFKNEGSTGSLCIDDLEVSSILHPDIDDAIGNAKKYLSSKEGTETGCYPHSSFTMLNDTVNKYADAANDENLSETQCEKIIEEINSAVNIFKNSIIMGTEQIIYTNGFEELSAGSVPKGFLVANNALVVNEHGGKAVKLSGNSRLLYRNSNSLTGSYRVSISFMQESKGAVEYLLDTGDTDGKTHGAWLKSDGTDILAVTADGNVPVITNYETNVWYDLQCVLSTTDKEFTVFVKTSEDEEYTEMGTYQFSGNMTSLGRISNTQIIVNGVSVYIDDLKCSSYMGEYENRANSVSLSCDRYVGYGESAVLTAVVYDKDYNPWTDQEVEISVVSGEAEISGTTISAKAGYSGDVKIKATTPDGIYDYAELTFLPDSEFEQLSIEEKDSVLSVRGIYPMLKYTECDLLAELTGDGISESKNCAVQADGSFNAEFSVSSSVKTQLLKVTVTDSDFGAEISAQYKHYGADATELFVGQFNSTDDIEGIVDEFIPVINIKTNFSYASHKAEYCRMLKTDGNLKDIGDLNERVERTNLLLGIKYATRENIKSVFEEGSSLLNDNGFGDSVKKLTDSKLELLYIKMIGFAASDVKEICTKAGEIAKDMTGGSGGSSGGGGGTKVPSYKNGGVSGGQTVVKEPSVQQGTEEASEETSFKDINEAMWAEKEISKLAQSGAVEGYLGYVRPNESITRAEFAKILVKLFAVEEKETTEFKDVYKSDWYAPYISALASQGIATGYPDDCFIPNASITRQDAAVMLARCIDVFKIPVYNKNDGESFADETDIAPYALDSVQRLRLCGVINGRGNNMFDPKGIITRAEAAVMTVKLENFNEAYTDGEGVTE